ncbi:hypothetical protein AI2716V1_0388 [Enterobacter cloacae]|nr:hypothetical protein AI2716V1_0388 [Enterobacter cloacae]CAH3342716.1 hypothetical protein AI2716V1_0388 [Enterobacter cloacae]
MSFISIPEKMEDQDIITLVSELGYPLKYDTHTYFFKDEVFIVKFESLKAEIKFWHIIQYQLERSQSPGLVHYD